MNVDFDRSTETKLQYSRKAFSCLSLLMRKPCSAKGVPSHGRSSSATNIPNFKSCVETICSISFVSDGSRPDALLAHPASRRSPTGIRRMRVPASKRRRHAAVSRAAAAAPYSAEVTRFLPWAFEA